MKSSTFKVRRNEQREVLISGDRVIGYYSIPFAKNYKTDAVLTAKEIAKLKTWLSGSHAVTIPDEDIQKHV